MKKRLLIVVACVLALLSFAALATACLEKTDVSVLAAASEGDVRRGEFFAVTEGTDMIVTGDYHGAKNLIFENTDFFGDKVYAVFNTDERKIVYNGEWRPYLLTFTDGEEWSGMFFCIDERFSGNYLTFYTSAGELVTDVEGEDLLIYDSTDDGTYRINASTKEGGVLDAGNGQLIVKDGDSYYLVSDNDSALSRYNSEELEETENYNVYFYPDGNAFVVLKKGSYTGGETVSLSSVTGSVNSANRQNVITLLPGDKIAVQEIILLPANTTKGYDFYIGESMYKLNTYIYDIAKGKTKKAGDVGYVITGSDYDKDGGFTACTCMQILSDRSLSAAGLQIFDEDMKVAVDIQSILPGATGYEAGSGYVVFKNKERIVVYRGKERVLDTPLSKLNTDYSTITVSGTMISADGNTVYAADGSKIMSLDDVGGRGFIFADYWQNYIYYYIADRYGDIYIYALNKNSREITEVCKKSSFKELCPGFVSVKASDGYLLYDMVTNSVIKEFASEPVLVGEVDGGYLVSYDEYRSWSTSGSGFVTCYAYLTR